MIINELILGSFGKFNNKSIKLAKGINVIYGENEAGKSTVHNFIDGMFYGFLKPYVKTRRYLEEHERYKPWYSQNYRGVIKFTYNGEDYIIEREFTKDKEETLILVDKTGEDITQSIDTGKRGRVLQPGIHFFGFSDSVFSNTISIKQLASRTEDTLAKEVRDKLINTSTSLDEDLSIEKSLDLLNRSLREIGSNRAPTSNYGSNLASLDKLKQERNRLLEYKSDYDLKLRKNRDIENELIKENNELHWLKERLKKALIIEKSKIYKDAKVLMEEVDLLRDEERQYEKYKLLSNDDYTEALLLKNKIDFQEESIAKLREELKEVTKLLTSIDPISSDIKKTKDLEFDYLKYEDLQEKKLQLSYFKDNQKEFLLRDMASKEKSSGKGKTQVGLGLLLGLGFLGYGIFQARPIFLGLAAILILTSFMLMFTKLKVLKEEIKELNDKLNETIEEEKEVNGRIKEIESLQKDLLEKHQVESKLELKQLYEVGRLSYHENKTKELRLEENKERKTKLLAEIAEAEFKKQDYVSALNNALRRNKSESIDEFKELLNRKDIYKKILEQIDSKSFHLTRVLGIHKMEDLEKELIANDIGNIDSEEDLDKSQLESSIEEKSQLINELINKEREIQGNLSSLNKELIKLVEVDEEIQRKTSVIEESDRKRSSIELARSTIELLSKDIHKQFAPGINDKVASTLEKITKGKYKSVRIDERLDVSIVNPSDGRMISIDSLSGGTIDQLYFSLRFGITDSIVEEHPPLILDDCFIQYDDSRLKQILTYLGEIGRERQIILFTCHKRELEILDSMKLDFNQIYL